MNLDPPRPIWTVFYVKDVGFMLGTAHYNRKGKLVDFRPGIAESWNILPYGVGHSVSVVPPSGQAQVKQLCNLPIVGKERKINTDLFNVRGRRAVALPVGYAVRPEDEMQVVSVLAITRYGLSVKKYLQEPQLT